MRKLWYDAAEGPPKCVWCRDGLVTRGSANWGVADSPCSRCHGTGLSAIWARTAEEAQNMLMSHEIGEISIGDDIELLNWMMKQGRLPKHVSYRTTIDTPAGSTSS